MLIRRGVSSPGCACFCTTRYRITLAPGAYESNAECGEADNPLVASAVQVTYPVRHGWHAECLCYRFGRIDGCDEADDLPDASAYGA